MKQLNNYIIEKLHLNKDIEKIDHTSFKQGDIIFHFFIYLTKSTIEINKKYSLQLFKFHHYDENDRICFIDNREQITDKYSWENNKFINSNGYIEYKDNETYYSIYLNKDDSLELLQNIIDEKESLSKIVSDYFDENDKIPSKLKLVNDKSQINTFIKNIK